MSISIKNGILLILIFFFALFLYTKILGPISFSVKNSNTYSDAPFQTSGTGEVSAVPDKASVSLGVTQHANTADSARAGANYIINKVTQDLKNLGIKEADIKTTNFSVYPDPEPVVYNSYESSSMPIVPRPTTTTSGFTASADIQVQAGSVDLANKAIDIASSDGANVIGGVSFTFDKDKEKDLKDQARLKAVQDAKEKAQALTKAAGIKLGKVINIVETDDSGYPMPLAASAKEGSDTSDQTSLNPGENKVSVTVTLTFETN